MNSISYAQEMKITRVVKTSTKVTMVTMYTMSSGIMDVSVPTECFSGDNIVTVEVNSISTTDFQKEFIGLG